MSTRRRLVEEKQSTATSRFPFNLPVGQVYRHHVLPFVKRDTCAEMMEDGRRCLRAFNYIGPEYSLACKRFCLQTNVCPVWAPVLFDPPRIIRLVFETDEKYGGGFQKEIQVASAHISVHRRDLNTLRSEHLSITFDMQRHPEKEKSEEGEEAEETEEGEQEAKEETWKYKSSTAFAHRVVSKHEAISLFCDLFKDTSYTYNISIVLVLVPSEIHIPSTLVAIEFPDRHDGVYFRLPTYWRPFSSNRKKEYARDRNKPFTIGGFGSKPVEYVESIYTTTER